MRYSAIIRVGQEYVKRGLFTDESSSNSPGACFMSLDREIQILGTQRIIDTPAGPIYLEPYTEAKKIRKIINRELKILAGLKDMKGAMERTLNQGILL